MNNLELYHVSEDPHIELFKPRPSPSKLKGLRHDCVFAINDKLLHNYLLPRDCPRVTYYAGSQTSSSDIEKFFNFNSKNKFVVAIEKAWLEKIRYCTLFLYKMPVDEFELLDEVAGYYVSFNSVESVEMIKISDLINEIKNRGVQLLVLPEIKSLALNVSKSTLNFSNIRIRNAI